MPLPVLHSQSEHRLLNPGRNAKWIWKAKGSLTDSQAIKACHVFDLNEAPASAQLEFSADSVARIFINGQWVADGPCRGWPEFYYFDCLEVSSFLKPGRNEITIVARYFGVGTFQRLPKRPGVILELTVRDTSGAIIKSVVTDKTWQVAAFASLCAQTPKIAIQLEPFEWHDARLAIPASGWQPAEELLPSSAPSRLVPRDVALPMRETIVAPPPSFRYVVAVEGSLPWAIPVTRLCHPGIRSLNTYTSRACGLAVSLHVDQTTEVLWSCADWLGFFNGQEIKGAVTLKPGPNSFLFFVRNIFHNSQDAVFEPILAPGVRVANPIDGRSGFPYVVVALPEFDFTGNDIYWRDHPFPFRDGIARRYVDFVREAGLSTQDEATFQAWLRPRSPLPLNWEVGWEDPLAGFQHRKVISSSICQQDYPISIDPTGGGDTEIQIDLQRISSGYFEVDIEAEEGTVLDLFAVEHVSTDQCVQHTGACRNGFRYVCRSGRQVFQSLVKRFGRHVFLRLRDQKSRATIHRVAIVESLYPVRPIATFSCSDPRLNQIWETSRRTMHLCMDDVFVDSLYEQTLWVGDAMVQQLYALWAFDARDISVRSMRLAAQSLSRLPLIGAQVPSSWEVILPAWSFLWGISVWDYYDFTGEIEVVREMWPAVRKNLLGAETYLNSRDLFDAPFWNLLEWAPMKFGHTCVIYNSMLMLAAVNAAIHCGELLDETDDVLWLRSLRERLQAGLNQVFNRTEGFFPDAILPNGTPVGRSLHPQFLALHFQLMEPDISRRLLQFLENPPEGTVDIASPFMTHFLYGAWEQTGQSEKIISGIRDHYWPMVNSGDGALWETLPGALGAPEGWPTRSRCHGWSASPLYYLPRTILGIRADQPGSSSYEIRPYLGDLEWAEGVVATRHGPLHIRVERSGGNVRIRTETTPWVKVPSE